MKLHLFVIFSFTILACFYCNAQTRRRTAKDDKIEEKFIKVKVPVRLPDGQVQYEVLKIDVTHDLQESSVDNYIEKLKKLMKREKKGGEKISSVELEFFSRRLLYLSCHPQLEDVTHIYKKWYKDISTVLKDMANIKDQYNLIQNKDNTKRKAELLKLYVPRLKFLNKLLENPKKIPEEELKKRSRKKKLQSRTHR